jgi:N-acetylneuraminate lyase
MTKLKGIFPALLTPFTKENKINEKALQKLVQMNINKGVSGFYVGGSTAEAFLLSIDERKYILDIVAQEAKGKCAIISHIGCISTDQAIELGKYSEKVGVDAISSIPPFYYNFSFNEIKSYYYDIVNNVNLPMIIYNFPAFSGVTLNSENVKEFLCDKRFIGVKHTSSDFYSLERFKQIRKDVLVYNGFDEMFMAGLAMGADGGIGSTYNFMAEKFIEIKKLFDQDKIEEAREVQTKANEIIKVLIKVGVMPGEKEILNMMGLDFGECRRPFKKINDEERELLKNVLKANG